MRKPTEVYDFKAFGQAIKAAKKVKGYTRERLGKELDIAPALSCLNRERGTAPEPTSVLRACNFF